ncbi:MAG: XRE family transcriptional regulator [Clostridia bacterium]|nr:XRE family transcriptional regulator [Clostridia bacterium]
MTNTGEIIALNLKRLRTERNLTLGQLSSISGISKAMLAEIEKGKSNPTINTILKIANGLNVPYTSLMEEIEQTGTLIRKEEAPMQSEETNHYRIYCYFKTTHTRNFEIFSAELDGKSKNASIGHSPKAQEFIYVMSGELTIEVGSKIFTIKEGDALSFSSSSAHVYSNNREETVKFMIINYYPT